MAKEVALTEIRHGKKDGEVVNVAQFDDVPSGVFTKDELQALRDAGAVGEPPRTAAGRDDEIAGLRDENATLQDEVNRLKSELAGAKAQKSGENK